MIEQRYRDHLIKVEEQKYRVMMLNDMVNELIYREINEVISYLKPSNTEIRRLMLVLRQETLKLDKML